jgi:hypothetical protein
VRVRGHTSSGVEEFTGDGFLFRLRFLPRLRADPVEGARTGLAGVDGRRAVLGPRSGGGGSAEAASGAAGSWMPPLPTPFGL